MSSNKSFFKRGQGSSIETDADEIARLRAYPDPDKIRDHLMQCIRGGNFGITSHFSWEFMNGDEKAKFLLLFAEFAQLRGSKELSTWKEEFQEEWDKFWMSDSGMKWKNGCNREDDTLDIQVYT
ncbi:uncharacterized protein TrAtP1_002271 [Trichoderma atroviride]|uniref:uncharacterized protein n=1 Tax=Hypocrea atroviridis TaxID=63577 RepID=UPI00331CD00A|nr:hypothetical protein TrAtP1_002271 [Trichoderma atroviride]